LLAHAGSNWARLAPTLRYRVQEDAWEVDGELITTTKLVPDGECELEAEELVGKRPTPTKTERAAEAIVAKLAEGSCPSREVKAEVMAAVRCGLDTVDRAATALRTQGVLGSTGSGPVTTWYLLTKPPDPEPPESGGGSNASPNTRASNKPPPDPGSSGSGGSDEAVWNGSGGSDRARVEEELLRRERRS
jgi:hypothetical protein